MIGGLPSPAGVIPDFDNPYSIAGPVRAVGLLCVVLTTLTTAIRTYTKFYIIKAHGWEDYTMFVAWVGFIAYVGVGFLCVKYGGGIHQWDVPITKMGSFAQWGNVLQILYSPIIVLTKLSICLQFIQIFVPNHNKRFWCIQGFIWVNTLYFVACFIVTIFQCKPRAKIWNPELPGNCVHYQAYILATCLFNVVSDFLMLVFPIICIWNLRMTTKRKVGVSAIFLVGCLALAASIVRVVFSAITNGSHDSTYTMTQVGVCTVGELTAGILVGNLVVFPRFFSTYSPKVTRLFSSYRSGRSRELLHNASPSKTLPEWPKTRNANQSTSWPDQHSANRIPGDYVELKDQDYKAVAIPPFTGRDRVLS